MTEKFSSLLKAMPSDDNDELVHSSTECGTSVHGRQTDKQLVIHLQQHNKHLSKCHTARYCTASRLDGFCFTAVSYMSRMWSESASIYLRAQLPAAVMNG